MTKGYPYVLFEDPNWRALLKQIRVLLGVLTGDLGDSRSPAVSPNVDYPVPPRGAMHDTHQLPDPMMATLSLPMVNLEGVVAKDR